MRNSRLIIAKNWRNFLFRFIRIIIILTLIGYVVGDLFNKSILEELANLNAKIPENYVVDVENFMFNNGTFTLLDFKTIFIRAFTMFMLFEGWFIEFIVKVICDSILMIVITRLYIEYSHKLKGDDRLVYLEQEKRATYAPKILACVFASIGIAIISIFLGWFSEDIVHNEKKAKIIAH